MSDDEQNVTRIGRPRAPHGYKTYHGPVEAKTRENNVQVITFTGSEESDLLHAADSWMAEHLDAVLIGLNWIGDFLSPHDIDPPGPHSTAWTSPSTSPTNATDPPRDDDPSDQRWGRRHP
ncbi:hypothetical protein ACFV0C_15925 [Streptomyces sp. NPDC059568]|uniref:hypothetical protein n=1 Tax=Streptomyces sp. NPDC059568 TaxID=3346868 RepID=UPI0036B657B3